uniref:Uncharacterized protein n=1 Tax=Laticauda laticaudata TaxID=8630 RepID=A0A8C5WWK1_LATLA
IRKSNKLMTLIVEIKYKRHWTFGLYNYQGRGGKKGAAYRMGELFAEMRLDLQNMKEMMKISLEMCSNILQKLEIMIQRNRWRKSIR